MFNKNLLTDTPFWIDDPNPYLPLDAGCGRQINPYQHLNTIFVLAWQVIVMLLVGWLAIQYPWLWLIVLYLGATCVLRYQVILKHNKTAKRSGETQQLAKERTGASTIGSAIHTAGHPYIQINQPVVLALKDDSLSIYSYQHATPLDTILLKDIQSLELVTYDDDGIPHTGIVDNTAQALQMHFLIHGQQCTCLFRRMYKVRAVGWYQAIQTARVACQV